MNPAIMTAVDQLRSTTTTAAAVTLTIVFVIAGMAKLHSPQRTASDFTALGLRSARPLARIVPMVELTVAAGLVLRPRLGGVVAIGMLLVFSAVLTRSMKANRGLPVRCSCFGSLNSEPISTGTLVRNAWLSALAAMAATTTHLARPDLASLVTVSMLAVITIVVSQLLTVRRQLGRIWSIELAGEPG